MQPLQFHPILKRTRWGGDRLGSRLGKPIGNEGDYGESWEVSDHPEGQSRVAGGEFDGYELSRLLREHSKDLLGRHAGHEQFPLLAKYLDANENLSVQVHPNDALAKTFDPRENGKTEAWIIIDAEPGSRVFSGLKSGVDQAAFLEHLEAGTLVDCLHAIPVEPGDCIFIPAGTVHAIGAGVLLAEVQQASDLTFRVYDWDRLGSDGQPRDLHLEESLQCIDWKRGPVDAVIPTAVPDADHDCEQLVSCDHFVLRTHRTETKFELPSADHFRILMTLSGEGTLRCADFEQSLQPGSTVLVPASAGDVAVAAETPLVVLEAFLPIQWGNG